MQKRHQCALIGTLLRRSVTVVRIVRSVAYLIGVRTPDDTQCACFSHPLDPSPRQDCIGGAVAHRLGQKACHSGMVQECCAPGGRWRYEGHLISDLEKDEMYLNICPAGMTYCHAQRPVRNVGACPLAYSYDRSSPLLAVLPCAASDLPWWHKSCVRAVAIPYYVPGGRMLVLPRPPRHRPLRTGGSACSGSVLGWWWCGGHSWA